MDPMVNLVLAAAAFLLLHLLVSGTRLRDAITARIGENAYLALFAIDGAARGAGDNYPLWTAPLWLHHLGGIVMLIAILFAVIGVLTPSPTMARQEGVLGAAEPARGILRITRHPFLWGAAVWAGFHLLVNGDLASTILFGMFLVLTVRGTVSIDNKRARKLGENWTAFAEKTSNIPFVAIVKGRNSLRLGEIGWWRYLAGVVVFGLLFYGHLYLFGVPPVPGWAPY
jgi:uncharacterized membrane protein